MTTPETNATDKAATVAAQGAHVAPEKAPARKAATPKKGAPKAKKAAKGAKPEAKAKAAAAVCSNATAFCRGVAGGGRPGTPTSRRNAAIAVSAGGAGASRMAAPARSA
jgi:hypothetical protein